MQYAFQRSHSYPVIFLTIVRKKGTYMKSILKLVGLGVVLAGAAMAAAAPEIDPASVGTPLALLGGAMLIIRSRIRR
jgi:hypothetical protein